MTTDVILVVDDDPQIRQTLLHNLRAHGYSVAGAKSGEEALEQLALRPPDVMLLDLSLPGIDGLEVIRQVRRNSSLPIIVLSVHGAEHRKVAALDAGADDFVTKPFGIEELLARVRAVLRRVVQPMGTTTLECGDLRIDLERHLVTMRGIPVHLTPIEFDLLKTLVESPGKVFTHRMLLQQVWHNQSGVNPHYLHVYIAHLRQKLESDPNNPRSILTEPGIGYRFAN